MVGVDQDGDVLDVLIQRQRDTRAAKRFFRKLLKGLRYTPRRIVTDKRRLRIAPPVKTGPTLST